MVQAEIQEMIETRLKKTEEIKNSMELSRVRLLFQFKFSSLHVCSFKVSSGFIALSAIITATLLAELEGA